MFERFFKAKDNKPEQKERKLLVPEFTENREMEEFAEKLNRLARDVIGYTQDGTPEDLAEARQKLDAVKQGEMGERLHTYLAPYLERDLPPYSTQVHQSEYNRWYAASILKQP
jgi:hypothetical protein